VDPQVTHVDLQYLLAKIYEVYHYDFRSYSEASLRRRLETALAHFGCESIAALNARLVADPSMFTHLLRYLTVQVSDMFRDPLYFKALREHVVPYLRTYASLRIWVAGCATGEEAYSLAILLREEDLLERSLIYATDINPNALRAAEAGIYELDRFAKFSEAYRQAGGAGSLSDYYTAGSEGALLDRKLRKAIVFSDHSLATDTAFAECQLVSCRNVLIYFEKDLQNRALGVITDSVAHRGFLGLGMKETLRFTEHAPRYNELVPEARIYQKL
jgi:chemotaxis protein methyltransferase CheR